MAIDALPTFKCLMIGHIKRERRWQKRENGDIKKERDREVLIEQHGRKQFERKKDRTNIQMQRKRELQGRGIHGIGVGGPLRKSTGRPIP